eukprot:3010976-Pyramimonas_sp.AAC.1
MPDAVHRNTRKCATCRAPPDVQAILLGPRSRVCDYCGTAAYTAESVGFCCQMGKHAINFD